jgi:hypothetical protein
MQSEFLLCLSPVELDDVVHRRVSFSPCGNSLVSFDQSLLYGVQNFSFEKFYMRERYQTVPRLDLQTRMYLLDLVLGSIPFKIVPLCSDTPIPAPFPLMECVLEILVSRCSKSILRFALDLLHSVKTATL